MKNKTVTARWRIVGVALAVSGALVGCNSASVEKSEVYASPDRVKVQQIIQALPAGLSFEARMNQISAALLGTPYVANTLIGGPTIPEQLVVRFDAVDCYTFIDLVRALAVARSTEDFITELEKTRYRDGHVAYYSRRHFLTDWWAVKPANAIDITARLTPHAVHQLKMLNQRGDGRAYIPGLPAVTRDITYIPPDMLDPAVLAEIKTGDVIGIYTRLPGLDVTHTGLAIWKDEVLYFRNASSLLRNMKVVDVPLLTYLQGKPGIVVMRPVAP